MAVYNGERYLEECIKSLQVQTRAPDEVIVVDDGSIDRTPDILESFSQSWPALKVLKRPNGGLTSALNLALEHATGSYIARMDADDVCLPTRFEEQIRFLDTNQSIVACGTWALEIDGFGREIRTIRYPSHPHEIKQGIYKRNLIIHPSLMVRADVMRSISGYDERFRVAQDYDLVLRIIENHAIANVPEELLLYRRSDEAISFKSLKTQEKFALKARFEAIKRKHELRRYVGIVWPCVSFFIPGSLKKTFLLRKWRNRE